MIVVFFFCKQKTAYERRISDWSSDVCSSDLAPAAVHVSPVQGAGRRRHHRGGDGGRADLSLRDGRYRGRVGNGGRARGARPVRGRRGGRRYARDRKSVLSGRSVSVRVNLGGRGTINKKNATNS